MGLLSRIRTKIDPTAEGGEIPVAEDQTEGLK